MAKPAAGVTCQQQAASLGIDKLRRHILLCTGPNCTDQAAGEIAWTYLKRRIAELGLHHAPHNVYRTRCACLRICTQGPIMVVYPDGVWYHSARPDVIERILQEHILQGVPVRNFVFAERTLGGPAFLPESTT